MKEFTNAVLSILVCLFAVVGCMSNRARHYQKVPGYDKHITLKYSADGFGYYDIELVISEYVQRNCCASEVEMNLRNHIKSEGLFVNKVEYLKDDIGDDYILIHASNKPTSTADWKEHRDHVDRIRYHNLSKKYSPTNSVNECECRYCTSGLKREYWYP